MDKKISCGVKKKTRTGAAKQQKINVHICDSARRVGGVDYAAAAARSFK